MTTILVVDDEAPIAELLVDIIEDRGFVAFHATNGVQGLVLARKERPALIISDVMMPGISGYELLEAVRATPELATTRVILMSAVFVPGALPTLKMAREQQVSADGYLRKPFDISEIEHLLDMLT